MSEHHFRAPLTTPDGRDGEVRFFEYVPPDSDDEREAMWEKLRTEGGYMYQNGVVVAKVGPAVAVDPDDFPDPIAAEIDAIEDLLVEYDEDGQLFGTSGAGAYPLAAFLAGRGVVTEEP